MKDMHELLKMALLGALIAMAISGVLLIGTATRVIDALPALVHQEVADARDQAIAAVTGELRDARADAVDQIAKTRAAAVGEIAQTRKALVIQVLDARLDLDQKIVAGLTLAHLHATEFEDRFDDTNKILMATARPIVSVGHQIDSAAPLFLDCDHNPDCLFNRYVGLSRGVEEGALAARKAAPALTKSAADLVDHADRVVAIADEFLTRAATRPPWWQRLLGFGRLSK